MTRKVQIQICVITALLILDAYLILSDDPTPQILWSWLGSRAVIFNAIIIGHKPMAVRWWQVIAGTVLIIYGMMAWARRDRL